MYFAGVLSAVASMILQYLTGHCFFFLFAGFTGIGLLSLGNVDIPSLMTTIGNVFLVGSVAKMAVTFPVAFHYFGGIRHIFWDKTPEALQNDQVESSSYAVLGASLAVTALAGLVL